MSDLCVCVCIRVQIEQEQGVVFELRTLNRSLQQKSLNLGEDSILDMTYTQPLSLLSEIQQSQVHTLCTDAQKECYLVSKM